jgi:hypothetical protein
MDAVDPDFNWEYSNNLHGEKLKTNLDVSHLCQEHGATFIAIIKKFWRIFNEQGTFTPVRNYECIIDTGTAAPIAH